MNQTERALKAKIEHDIPGVFVDVVSVTKGYWSHAHQDCCRWEAAIVFLGTGLRAYVQSWDTPRACLRKQSILRFCGGSQYQPDEIEISENQ